MAKTPSLAYVSFVKMIFLRNSLGVGLSTLHFTVHAFGQSGVVGEKNVFQRYPMHKLSK